MHINNSLSQSGPVYSEGQTQSQVPTSCVPPFIQTLGTQPSFVQKEAERIVTYINRTLVKMAHSYVATINAEL